MFVGSWLRIQALVLFLYAVFLKDNNKRIINNFLWQIAGENVADQDVLLLGALVFLFRCVGGCLVF